jgi:hypothetical protein
MRFLPGDRPIGEHPALRGRAQRPYIRHRALDGDRTLSDSPSEPTIDLAYIGQALQRLTGEVASLRDDMHVLTAIVQRLDNSQGRMLEELRGMHRQYSRLSERVRQLEAQP